MADYLAFYGLSEDPFKDAPNPKFYFPAESHQEALLSLQYGIAERKGFVLLLGEKGSGKTTLLNHLLSRLDEKTKAAFIRNSGIAYKKILKEILHQLDVPIRLNVKGAMVHELYNQLIEDVQKDHNAVIILDEAQRIDIPVLEEVRLLANLETSTSKLVQIILSGEPELQQTLRVDAIRQIGQRIAVTARIGPMTEEESYRYIDHRLRIAGSSSARIFSQEALRMICRRGAGLPRALNVLCSNSLTVGLTRSENIISAATVRRIRRRKELIKEEAIGRRWVPAIKFRIPRTAAAFVLSTLLLAAGVYWGRDTIRSVAGPYVMSLLADKDSPKITYVAGPTAGKAPLKEMAAAPAAAPHQIKAAAPPAAQNENQETAAAQLPAAKNESANKESEEQNRPAVSMSESAPPAVPARIKAIVEASNGTSLSKLAIKHYNYVNATIIDYILEANPSIIHPDLILIKQKIRLPEITLNSCIKPSGNGEFRIHLATFVSRTFAEQYIEKTGLSRRDTSIFPRKVSGRDMWFRVMSGPYQSWDKTMDALGNFKNRGLLAF